MKDRRRVLAHRRMEFNPDTYGERRDSERPEASNLSSWIIEPSVGQEYPARLYILKNLFYMKEK